MQSMLRNHPPTLTGSRQPPVKATCFADGYALNLDTSWLRVSQGQIDDPLTQKMLNLLLQFGEYIKLRR